MAPKNDGSVSISSEAWNVAEGYVKLKILKQLVLCDKLETISLYGTEDIDDLLFNQFPSLDIPNRRIEAIQRLKDNIIQLIGNVKFAIRQEDGYKFEALRERILLVEEMLDAVAYESEDMRTHMKSVTINEDWFRKMLREMCEIKEKINVPINNAGLIFRNSDEMDFEELLNDIATGG